MRARFVPLLLSFLLLASLLPAVAANPGVPYCLGTASPVAPTTAPEPPTSPATCKMVTGRVFPEANVESLPPGSAQLPATDYVSYFEARAGLQYLAAQYPDWMNLTDVAQSYGLWNGVTQQRDHFPIMVVQVTNHKSPIPMRDRQQLLFMLSIHGVEKGGREGGLRVIEDLVSNMGIATQRVQNGAGLKQPLAKPTRGTVETYRDYLDFTTLVFLFPNADGWAHDEAPYFDQGPASGAGNGGLGSPGPCGGNGELMCRTNGNGTDLNRQAPTIGWALIGPSVGRLPMNEPEPQGYIPWLEDHFHFNYAIDIHGMPNNYILAPVMMSAGAATPQEMLRSTSLAETLKQRLNGDPFFATWLTAMGTAQTAGEAGTTAVAQTPAGPVMTSSAACQAGVVDCASPTTAVGSRLVADWGTVWDSIGYTDSGFSGDFFAQHSGLDAPGYDIEMAYNHIETDSQYEYGNQFNGFHVEIVRHIVKSFLDAAAQDVQVSIETHGTDTVVLKTSFVATNLDDKDKDGNPMPTPGGWADHNKLDYRWRYSLDHPFFASPAKYWTDLQPFLRDGDRPGALHLVDASGLTPDALAHATSLVIPGSAIQEIEKDPAKVDAVKAFVQNGGNLVLTDEGMRFLDLAGITSGAVDKNLQYAGAINMDRAHELTNGVRGVARQTYEPVPLGYTIQSNSAPTWFVNTTKFKAIGGDVAGYGVHGQNGAAELGMVTLGQLKLGKGSIKFIGALLPDPTEEFYHPYGLDGYATTYSGNQILRNMLGWEETFVAPPIVIQGDGHIVQSSNAGPSAPASASATATTNGKGTPGLEVVAVVATLGAAVVLARRRQA